MFDNVTWPKAALIGGLALLIVGLFNPDAVERIIAAVISVVQILAAATRNLGG